MNEIGLWEVINKCQHLKFKFSGVFSADNFPVSLDRNTFVIVNSDDSDEMGTHWMLFCNREGVSAFADPLGFPIDSYQRIYQRLNAAKIPVVELVRYQLQKPTSNFCGLYCIYIAHFVFSSYYPSIPMITENDLLRFLTHTL